jgi:putative FmdB family regulatory protein
MMRMYDFECTSHSCGHTFEELVKYEDADKLPCPLCNNPTRRLIGAPMIDPKLGLDAANWPTMGDKWARIRRQRKQIESRRSER